MFEALLALLESLSDPEPVVLVVEDLHWADSSTRSFIGFLSRTICSERLLVLGTYRSDELHRRHPLRPLLAELASDAYARLLELPRFTPDELAEQLEGILAGTPDPELVERLYSRSEGNALFAEEILAAGLDGRGSLPPTLRDALMLRVERLSPRAQELLRWLACQPAADHALVAAVAGLEPAELRDALREAVASHIVVTVDDESYGFRHALLREVVYDDLLPGERSEMHAALARRAGGADRATATRGAHITAQAAHHWAAAGDQPQALAAAVRAALAAERVNAFGEAQALFERALALWERVPEPERLAGLERGRAAAPRGGGGGPGGRPRAPGGAASARARAGGRGRPIRAARRSLHERLGQSLWSQHHQDDSVEALREGTESLLSDEPSAARAKLLAQLARRRMVQSRFSEAAECAREAHRGGARGGAPRGRRRSRSTRSAPRSATAATSTPGVGVSARIARDRERGGPRDGGGRRLDQHLGRAELRRQDRGGARGGAPGPRGRGHARLADGRLAAARRSPSTASTSATGRSAEEAIPAASRRHSGGSFLYWQICRASSRSAAATSEPPRTRSLSSPGPRPA